MFVKTDEICGWRTMVSYTMWLLITWISCLNVLADCLVNDECFKNLAGYKNVNSKTINVTHPNKDMCLESLDEIQIIEISPQENNKNDYKDLYICWPGTLLHGTLIFNGAIQTTKPDITIKRTCNLDDSIVIYQSPNSTLYVLLRMYSPSALVAKYTPLVQYGTNRPFSDTSNDSETEGRVRRQVIDHPSYTKHSAMTDSNECGHRRSCFRKGKPSCQHLECDYFLSYRYLKDTENVDIEISGKTTGWVAVGFSSDRTMGGDEIFACMFRRENTLPIRAASFENPHPHMRPTEKENLTLQHSTNKNGYLFCRFEVPVKRKDHTVDLTNEWIQFYAFGGMAGLTMEKHMKKPMMSSRHISIVEHMNVINSAAMLSPMTTAIIVLLAVL